MAQVDACTGRFAPSPTGPLHFGSLVAALASYLDARHRDGRWLLRVEDLDPPRESPSAPAAIINQLRGFGFIWDGEILYQSARLDAYQAALDRLAEGGHVYACTCSRKETGPIYNGRCRGTLPGIADDHAIRLLVDRDETIEDRILGRMHWHPGKDVGDFIVRRKDGLFAYQLAVVVDDDYQGITDVVRGSDLLDSTPRQMVLIRRLGYSRPRYAHFPVIVGPDGTKLSKQTRARPVDPTDPLPVLRMALTALGQPDPGGGTAGKLLDRAARDWDIRLVPRRKSVQLSALTEQP